MYNMRSSAPLQALNSASYLQGCMFTSDCEGSYEDICCSGYYKNTYNPTFGSTYSGF